MNQELKEVLDRARGELSMVEFAKKCGISANTLYRWMRGHQKTALRKDIINKICENAAPNSGVTGDQVYDASVKSIESENREIFERRIRVKEISDAMKQYALQTCVQRGYSVKEIPDQQIKDTDYELKINDRIIFYYDLIASPEGSFHKGSNVSWWHHLLEYRIGHYYMLKQMDNRWIHIVIAINSSEEAEMAMEKLEQSHCKSELQVSVIILDLEKKRFVKEYELGMDKEEYMRKSEE